MRQPLLRRSGGSDEGGANDVRLSQVVDYGGPPPVLENIKSSIQDLQDGVVRRLSDDWGSLDQGAPGTPPRGHAHMRGPSESGRSFSGVRHSFRRFSLVNFELFSSGKQKRKRNSAILLLAFHVIATIVWACLSALFYVWRLGWSFTGALYFTIQAGFGVGFGGAMILNEGQHMTLDVLYFTTIGVCLGGSMSVFSLFAFFLNECRLHAFESSNLGQKERQREGRGAGALLLTGPVSSRRRLATMCSKAVHWMCGGWLNALVGNRVQLPAFAYAGVVFAFVLIAGLVIGVRFEGLTPHESIYFTISAIQSSGMISPRENYKSELSCMFLVLLGVPVYAAFMSLFLESLMAPYQKLLQRKMLRRPNSDENLEIMHKIRTATSDINKDDRGSVEDALRKIRMDRPSLSGLSFHFKTSAGGGGGANGNGEFGLGSPYQSSTDIKRDATTPNGLNWTEFLEAELMRLGVLELDTLQAVWESFCVQCCVVPQGQNQAQTNGGGHNGRIEADANGQAAP